MAETFKLPCSSYEELIKLFQAYANTKEGTALSLDEITQATGVPRTIVSKNNGFMVQVGLITEGNKKAATETGLPQATILRILMRRRLSVMQECLNMQSSFLTADRWMLAIFRYSGR